MLHIAGGILIAWIIINWLSYEPPTRVYREDVNDDW
jgi:hypothetical protein